MKEPSRFVQICFRLTDLIILNVIYVLCCIPIFTIGAATTGLYYTTLKMARDQESAPIYKDFFKSFKENFRQSTLIWLGMLAFGIFLYLDFRICTTIADQAMRSMLFGFLIVVLVIYMCLWTYIFPLISRFYNTTRNMIRNSFALAVRKFFYTFPMVVINLTPLLVVFVPGDYIKWMLAAYTFIWFAAAAYINSRILASMFEDMGGALD